jgi:hypothetical protein
MSRAPSASLSARIATAAAISPSPRAAAATTVTPTSSIALVNPFKSDQNLIPDAKFKGLGFIYKGLTS